MDPETFEKQLKEASVHHDIALINKRTQNYEKSIESHQQALHLYQTCYRYYKSLDENCTIEVDNLQRSPSRGNAPRQNIELKISQTYQCLAQLYTEYLNDDSSAVKAHEDAITLLIEGSSDADNGSVKIDECDHVDGDELYGSPRKNHPCSNRQNDSPNSVLEVSLSSEKINAASVCTKSGYNIVKLTRHERARIISMSLTSLAQIYFRSECHHGSDLVQEDPLRYYQEALNFLRTVPDPKSSTYIPALSNDKGSGVGFKRSHSASDASLTVASFGEVYSIDLRIDIANILVEMALLQKRRGENAFCIEALEQARDLKILLESDMKDQEMVESLLGLAYERVGEYEKAFVCYQHVLKLRKVLFGQDSLQVANLYASMSNLYRKAKDFAQSLSWNKRAIHLYQICERSDVAPTVADVAFEVKRNLIGTLQNQGTLYVEMSELDRAIASYLVVIEKQVDFQGEEHPDVARTLNVLGDLYMIKNDLSEAKASFDRALKLYRKYGMGDADPDMVSTLQCLSEIESLMGDSKGNRREDDLFEAEEGKVERHHHSPPKKVAVPLKDFNEEFFPVENEENGYCQVIETDPRFLDNEDAVSQITFITHKDMSSVARNNQNECMVGIDNWSPAEYVFKAVDRLADGINQVTKQFLHMEPDNLTKGCERDVFPIIEEEEGYEVREFESKLTEPTYSGSNSGSLDNNEGNQSRSFDNETKPDSTKSQSYSRLASCDSTKSFDHDAATRIGSAHTPSIDRDREKKIGVGDESVANNTCASSTLYGMKINTDDSVGAWTHASSTLYGVNINTGNSTSTDNPVTGYAGLKKEDDEKKKTESQEDSETLKSSDGCRMDDLLAQMNVVTCDMEGDDAKPFQELLKGEIIDDKEQHSDMIHDDTFEKLSACLDSLIELKDKHGPGHAKVISTMLTLAALYIDNGDRSKGVKKYHEALELCQKKYGRSSVQVSNIYVKLGKYYLKERDIDKAVDNYGHAKDIEIYLYGNSHPRIAKLLNYMGLAELERNEFDGDLAMNYLHEALKIQKMHLGPNEINPDISETLVHMGAIYYKERNSFKKIRDKKDSYKSFIESGMLGKIAFAHSERGEYIMAMNFYDEVLELLKNKDDGRYMHRIVATLKSLGGLNVKAGRFAIAMEHYLQALKLIESSDDASPLNIANAKGDIGVVRYHQGDFREATRMLEHTVSVQRALLSNEHPRVAKTLFHLGVIKRATCDFERASYTLKQAQRIQLSSLQEDHPDTILTQIEIGKVLLDSDKVDEAISQFESIFKNQRHLFGSEHPDLAQTLYYIGICLARNGDVSTAMKYFERCFRMQQKVLRIDCPAIASTLDQIGLLLLCNKKVQKASKAFAHSLQIRREVGEDYYEIAYSLLNMGRLSTFTRSYNEATVYYKDAMRIAVRSFGLEHSLIGDIHVGVGNLNTRKCQFDEAKKELMLALDIYKKTLLSEAHVKVRKAKEDLKRVEHEEALCV